MQIIRKYSFIIIILLIFSALLGLFFLKNQNHKKTSFKGPASSELSSSEYKEARDRYINLLNSDGPRVALEQLREEIKINNPLLRSCHSLVHELGFEAYKKYGGFSKAVEFQDEICNSGFLHGVIEAHFLNSPDISVALSNTCPKNSNNFLNWQCNHGIGHGVMYYTANDLYKSLEMCERLEKGLPASSCINGVFMENFNTDQKLHKSKYLKESDPFYPCNEVVSEYKADCYLYAPTYYLSINKNAYSSALNWCKGAEDSYKTVCANGVGSQVMKENINDPIFVEKVCMSGEDTQVSDCIVGAVGLYINHFGSIEPAKTLCGRLKESNRAICERIVLSNSLLYPDL